MKNSEDAAHLAASDIQTECTSCTITHSGIMFLAFYLSSDVKQAWACLSSEFSMGFWGLPRPAGSTGFPHEGLLSTRGWGFWLCGNLHPRLWWAAQEVWESSCENHPEQFGFFFNWRHQEYQWFWVKFLDLCADLWLSHFTSIINPGCPETCVSDFQVFLTPWTQFVSFCLKA